MLFRSTSTEVFSPELYYLSQLPADMDSFETGIIVLMALALSFLATLYPSWRAARLDPVAINFVLSSNGRQHVRVALKRGAPGQARVAITALFALPTLAYAAGVAMVTDLQGKASATGDGRLKDVTILSEIDAGAQVQLAAGGALVAMYLSSGAEYAFKGPATIVFKGDQPDVTSGAKPEKRNAALGDRKSTRLNSSH